jgi:benzoyl-CoA reductase subunit A
MADGKQEASQMTENYGIWPESDWISSKDQGKVGKYSAGIDLGTTSAQAVIFADGELFSWASIRVGSDFAAASNEVMKRAIGSSGLEISDFNSVVATGFGRKNVMFATDFRDEIMCHAKGARFMFGAEVKTVIDIGGQSTHAIGLYDWDRVRIFQTNDKCATGMGRHIETVAELLHIPITEMGKKSLETENEPEPVSTTCYNFAYPETVGLLRQGYKEEKYSESDILAAHMFAVAWRIMGTIGKIAALDIGDILLEGGLAFTGGLAKNEGITRRLERDLKMQSMSSPHDPQLAGAIGAALLA